jgi:dTDP-glucose 4,6-dehydratase
MAEHILVTGGAGFIGSAVCRHLVRKGGYRVVNVDKLTYAGNPESLREISDSPDYVFHQADINDDAAILDILRRERIDRIMHLAAESHVDRSIDGPAIFLETNVMGTFRMLNAALTWWRELEGEAKARFRFHHISTDEVFGELPFDSGIFTEETPYAPSSPYSASSRTRLARDLPASGRALQLLEQLRPFPLSREADSARHPERARGQAASRLRQGRECPRLAVRG